MTTAGNDYTNNDYINNVIIAMYYFGMMLLPRLFQININFK